MDRREFVKAGIAASVMAGTKVGAMPTKRRRPNVLYVFSDQQRAASMPGEPYCEVKAPNLDAFFRSSFSMDTCISNYPVCTPYRGIFMTGRYPSQTGLIGNANEGSNPSNLLAMKTTETTITKTFKSHGYHTGYVGKWHLGGDGSFTPKGPRRFDIDEWHTWSDTASHYHSYTFDPDTGRKIMPKGWSPSFMTDQAVSFLKAQPTGADAQPWFLVLSWNPPHPAFDPPAMDQAPYRAALKKRPNFRPVATDASWTAIAEAGLVVNDPRMWNRSALAGLSAQRRKELLTEQEMHGLMQGYFGGITAIDLEFARVLKALEETGQANDTIVIFTSDHGEMLGSQGRMAKSLPFEESCRVPFAVRYPGVTPKGGSSKALFAAIDIYPTVCGLANLPVPAHCMGKDLSAIIRGEKSESPDIVFLMSGKANKRVKETVKKGKAGNYVVVRDDQKPSFRGARTATHTYAVTEEGRWLLYDNVADPYQMNNLANDPANAPLMASLDVKIQEWISRTGDAFLYPHLG